MKLNWLLINLLFNNDKMARFFLITYWLIDCQVLIIVSLDDLWMPLEVVEAFPWNPWMPVDAISVEPVGACGCPFESP